MADTDQKELIFDSEDEGAQEEDNNASKQPAGADNK
jgi:hypothetical protein